MILVWFRLLGFWDRTAGRPGPDLVPLCAGINFFQPDPFPTSPWVPKKTEARSRPGALPLLWTFFSLFGS